MSVHESLTGWESMPAKDLDGLRAIAVTYGGTTIDGRLVYSSVTSVFGGDAMEQLAFADIYQPVITNYAHAGNMLASNIKTITILKETR